MIAYLLLRSRIGLALTAIRDDEAAARSLGVDVLRTKVLVWIVAAFGCGVAGAVIYLNLHARASRIRGVRPSTGRRT